MPILTNTLALKDATTLTIASGVITVTQSMHVVAAESGTADDLTTINLGSDVPTTVGSDSYRAMILLRADTGDTITVKHGTGIVLANATDYVLSGRKTLQLFYTGAEWVDLQSSGITGSTGTTDNAVLRADGTGGTRLQSSGVTIDDSNNVSGVVNLALDSIQFSAATKLTIASGVITVTRSVHTVDTEGNAATDDLDTINGGAVGEIIYLRADNDARTVVLRNGVGNILTYAGNNISLDEDHKIVALFYNGTNWLQLGDEGTVSSVGLSTNATYLTVGSSPVTSSGTITLNKATGLTANQVVATPDGAPGAADLRALVANDIPSLDASKTTTGTFNDARIPNLDASKVTTGAFDAARIPSLDASKTTSGTFDAARIPNLDGSKITSGSVAIAQGGTGQTTAVAAFDALAPSTSKGDLIAHDGTDNVRVGVGDNNTVLLADSAVASGVKWGSVPAASVSAGTFPAGAFTFTTSVSAPVLTATNTSTATEGADVAVNGTFDVDANWTKGTGWTIGGGVATKTAGTQSDLSQSVGQAANQVVRVRFNYTRTAGVLSVILGGTTYGVTYSSASGSVDIYIRATNTGTLSFRGDASFAGTIDNVVVNIISPRSLPVLVPTVGIGNFAIGANALANVTSGTNNTAVGADSMRFVTVGLNNVGIGSGVFNVLTNASNNVAIGTNALRNAVIVDSSVAIGTEALLQNTVGYYQVAIGHQAAYTGSNTANAVAIGYRAAYNGSSSAVAIGYEAGFTNSNGSVFIGNQAGRSETNSNRLYIANSNTATPLIFGQFSGTGAGLTIHSQATNGVPLIVKGIASQSSNLQQWQDSTGAVLGFVSASGGLTINEQGNDADTRIEGDTDVNLLFVDASADSVQIGSATTADSAKFYVLGKISGSGEFEINGDLNHDGSNVGFYGTAPIAQQTLATGTSKTVDDVITALQALGLVKQA